MSENARGLNTIIGLAGFGPVVVGLVSFIAALFPLVNGNFVGAGVLLIASALAFGLLSIAVLGR